MSKRLEEGLTLTWDVLKCKQTYDSFAMPFKININMRCIEIWWCDIQYCQYHWLTLTWDVLKLEEDKENIICSLD